MTTGNNKFRFTPIIISVSIVFGIIIGTFYTRHSEGGRLGIISEPSNKLTTLLRIIDEQYVDTPDINGLVEKTMPAILGELDPHSQYIPAKEQDKAQEKILGSFSGIGVQFTIRNDSLNIMKIVKGGPSEKVGLLAGDRIVAIDDSAFVGSAATDDNAMRMLKGPKGSPVKITVFRPSVKKTLDFTVNRGDVPITSIDSRYMITDDIGYIKINTFSLTTYEEMLGAIVQLRYMGCKSLIIDLRGNLGGVMEIAIRMINEFLPKDKLITYTKGRKMPVQQYYSDGNGTCQDIPLVVLIDEASASASEIFAGAIQDNDRGSIVGRRSFGKGLVQQPIDFRDGSSVRLTIARYYTPSGRCVQKPYVDGKDEAYELDIFNRYEHGEFFSKDSIKVDENEKFFTSIGRTVYGGGGVIPDYFIPQDTTGITSYFRIVNNTGLIAAYAFEFADKHRKDVAGMDNIDDVLAFLKKKNVVEDFIRYADKNNVKRRNLLIRKSYKRLEEAIVGSILYDIFDMEEYMQYANRTDKIVQKAVEIIESGKAYPKLEEEDNNGNNRQEGTEA